MVETRDLDENTVLDVDADGNICSITVEHASTRTDILTADVLQIRPLICVRVRA